MREIGGYFQLDQLIDKPYYKNLVELNTGRNALLYLVKAKKISKIYLPYFLCNSVSDMLSKYGINFEYYHIGKDFFPIFEEKLKEDEYLYIVNYYGQIINDVIRKFKEEYKNIILDNTQSFFQKPDSDIDTIYSCRKYFGVPDGAYLSTNIVLDEILEEDQSSCRMKHILGRFEGEASGYYIEFKKNDEAFKELPIKSMSKLTRNILGAVDYEKVIETRNRNFEYLHDCLVDRNILDIKLPYGPFAYPFYVENGIEIKKKLAEKKIYIPTLWPNVLKENHEDSIEYDYAANILPLPCDQRYGVEDMDKIVKDVCNISYMY
ncbi:MAG: hypothetical protein EOM50_12495 [Erysipelotrichia bacterium]|nr:hypothetical protein [Erysipelotrichia bacterium]